MNRLKRTVNTLSAGNSKIFTLSLASACLLILIRLLKTQLIFWDLSIQLEAAYRFAEGLGLTTAFSPQFDVAQPPISEKLTHFPPGLSVIFAPFIAFNLPIEVALKFVYTVTTLVGWVGWSALAARCLSGKLKVWQWGVPLHWFMAAVLPFLFTPHWTNQGTDVILWAGIPVTILPLLSNRSRHWWPLLTAFSGAVVGALISIRYASAFLLLAVPLLMLYLDWPRVQHLFRRLFVFGSVCFSVLLPTVLFIKLGENAEAIEATNDNLLKTHGARYLSSSPIENIFDSLSKLVASFAHLHHLLGTGGSTLDKISRFSPILGVGLGFLLLGWMFWICLWFARHRDNQRFSDGETHLVKQNALMAIACLLIAFVFFSVVLNFLIAYSPLDIVRYYLPLQPALLLLIYGIATLPYFTQWSSQLSKLLILAFIIPALLLRPAERVEAIFTNALEKLGSSPPTVQQPVEAQQSGEDAQTVREESTPVPVERFLTSPEDVPINYTAIRLSHSGDSLKRLMAIQHQEPDSLFFVQHYPMYLSYISLPNPLSLRRIPDRSFWQDAYVSQKTRIYWITNEADCPSVCASPGNFNSDSPEREIPELSKLPGLETVFVSDQENTRILVSDLPAGYRFGQ